MSRQFPRDYITELNLGNISGRAGVNIRGHDESVPNGGPFGLSPQFGGNSFQFDQSAIDRTAGTPAVVSVASTDNTNDNSGGTGALTVKVFGLDASGNLQNENLTMNGTTAVVTSNTYSALFQVLVLTTGSNNANVGTIYCGTGTFTSGVPAVRMLSMEIGHNLTLSAYYVVPLGKRFVLRQFVGTIATGNKDVEIRIETSVDGAMWITQAPFGLEAGDFAVSVIALPPIPAGTHIRLRATGLATATITSFLAGELVDD